MRIAWGKWRYDDVIAMHSAQCNFQSSNPIGQNSIHDYNYAHNYVLLPNNTLNSPLTKP